MLKELVAELEVMIDELKEIHSFYYKIWHKSNKPFGWEQMDTKLGSLDSRLKTTVRRAEEYLAGDVESLPEFEAERLYYNSFNKPMLEVNRVETFDRPSVEV